VPPLSDSQYFDLTHIALRFEDLRAAEEYYAALLDLDVAWRDTRGDVSMFATWEQIEAADAQPWVSALYAGNLRVTIEAGEGSAARTSLGLDHVGLHVSQAQLARIAARSSDLDLEIEDAPPGMLVFSDRHGLRWELDTRSHADLVALGEELEALHAAARRPS
jgi:catechol 2,3-dioxygenase-like lactoylglutathione lyase family enzyme